VSPWKWPKTQNASHNKDDDNNNISADACFFLPLLFLFGLLGSSVCWSLRPLKFKKGVQNPNGSSSSPASTPPTTPPDLTLETHLSRSRYTDSAAGLACCCLLILEAFRLFISSSSLDPIHPV
jgi:hypothetical protein